MTSSNTFFVRLPISVHIFNAETHELIHKTHSTKKSMIRFLVTAFLRQNAHVQWVGECKITYSQELDIWNAFSFTNYAMLDRNLSVCTEKEFLIELARDGSLEKRFLAKRKISEKQRQLLREHAKKSPLFKKKTV